MSNLSNEEYKVIKFLKTLKRDYNELCSKCCDVYDYPFEEKGNYDKLVLNCLNGIIKCFKIHPNRMDLTNLVIEASENKIQNVCNLGLVNPNYVQRFNLVLASIIRLTYVDEIPGYKEFIERVD